MGLDQYLYRTSKRRMEAVEKFDQLRAAFNEEGKALREKPKWKELMSSLPRNEFGYYDWKSYTKEQKVGVRNMVRAYRRLAKKHGLKLNSDYEPIFNIEDFGLNYEDDDLEEIGYWRKEWGLHNYIINKFGDPNNDNLVEIYFSKVGLEMIVADGYGGPFKDALDRWDDDYVVFYHPWY